MWITLRSHPIRTIHFETYRGPLWVSSNFFSSITIVYLCFWEYIMGPILASFTLGLAIYERGLPLFLRLNIKKFEYGSKMKRSGRVETWDWWKPSTNGVVKDGYMVYGEIFTSGSPGLLKFLMVWQVEGWRWLKDMDGGDLSFLFPSIDENILCLG